MLRRISTSYGNSNHSRVKKKKTIKQQINNIETFFKNHFRMDSDMVLDQNTYFKISTQISEVEYVCYTPSKQYISKKNDIPEIYQLFREQANNIKRFFPNNNVIIEEYNLLAEIPDVENTIALLYNIEQNLPRSYNVCYVYFYYDNVMFSNVFSNDYIIDKKILKTKKIDDKDNIYLYINFQKPETPQLVSRRNIDREEYNLRSARYSILYNMFEKKRREFESIENESADLIIGEIQSKLNSGKKNIYYLFFFQDLGKQAGSQINEKFLKICKTFNGVERINIIYCPLIGLTQGLFPRGSLHNNYYLPYSNTVYYDKNISQAISHIKEQIMIKMQTTEKNTLYSSFQTTISSMLNYNKQTEIKNIFVAPFFYRYLANIDIHSFFADSMVQLRSYLPCEELNIADIDYHNISPYINRFQVYRIFLMKYKKQLSKSCKCFYAYLSRFLGNYQKQNLSLSDMSYIIDSIPNTIIDNLSNIIEDVHNIALNYLNSDFGYQNTHTSNTNDLYITVYKDLPQGPNVL